MDLVPVAPACLDTWMMLPLDPMGLAALTALKQITGGPLMYKMMRRDQKILNWTFVIFRRSEDLADEKQEYVKKNVFWFHFGAGYASGWGAISASRMFLTLLPSALLLHHDTSPSDLFHWFSRHSSCSVLGEDLFKEIMLKSLKKRRKKKSFLRQCLHIPSNSPLTLPSAVVRHCPSLCYGPALTRFDWCILTLSILSP